MYSYEDRMKAVQLYIQYDCCPSAVIYELGYPSRNRLTDWYKEYKVTGTLRSDDMLGHSKYSKVQRKQAVENYLEHGRSVSRAIKALGYPGKTVLCEWLNEDIPGYKRRWRCKVNSALVKCTPEQKEQAVIDYCAGNKTPTEIAKSYGVSPNAVYSWKKKLLSKGYADMKKETPAETVENEKSIDILRTEKEALEQKVKDLERDVYHLQLERDILEKAGEILKKDQGISLVTLTNREKAVVIDVLRDKYRLKLLLKALNMAKSSYCYQENMISGPDKYNDLRVNIKDIFSEVNARYGYRRIYLALKNSGKTVSEKVVRWIMKEEHLIVPFVKRKKYSSYIGEVSPAVENIVNRDFHADNPNEKWLTDITEFHIQAGKVYLSPIIDCFDGLSVSWAIGTSPDANLANAMFDNAISTLKENEHPIIHSDRGGHYRWPGWIERMDKASLTRSMSRKGCSPDNSACEGFFGRLKNEFFYCRSWIGVTVDEFIKELDEYITWYNEDRIKISLGGMSPIQHRRNLGLIA
ncbi:MAG: IS3 family transposase [Lentisphaerae bacterium]|nr:IS3 family transposase [Lentisphaerota bacterium]